MPLGRTSCSTPFSCGSIASCRSERTAPGPAETGAARSAGLLADRFSRRDLTKSSQPPSPGAKPGTSRRWQHRLDLSFGPQMVSVDSAEIHATGCIGPELRPCTGADLIGRRFRQVHIEQVEAFVRADAHFKLCAGFPISGRPPSPRARPPSVLGATRRAFPSRTLYPVGRLPVAARSSCGRICRCRKLNAPTADR
jgi:hypothetical protein